MSFDEDACYDTCLDVPHVHGGKLIAIPGGNGPPGIQGPAGPPGVSDVPGPTGPAGPQGAPGPVGPTGPASTVPGPAGATGPAGPTGPEGPAGPAGAKGDVGATGADGVQGVQGEQGPAGLGIKYRGEVATVAELPTTGNISGDLWVIGNRDDDSKPADSYVWDEDQQDWVYAGAIQGVQGVQGVQGPVGPEGPAGADGATGPAGPKGDTGDQGPPGETSGVVGPEGPQGPPGADGATGPAGPQGDVGPAGAKGDPGIQGPQGVAGADGATGPAGADGAPGPSAVSADAGNASVLGTDGLIFTPAGGGLVAAPSVSAFPATGEPAKVYLAEDTGDTFRFDATAKGTDTYVRISESTLSTKIEDSTQVGRDVVTAVDALSARTTIEAQHLFQFDVRDFGAVGDGVADDTAAIHAARDAAGVGGTVVFPAGTYKIVGSAGVGGLKANVASQVWNVLPGATLIQSGNPKALLTVDAENVTITGGGTLDGGRVALGNAADKVLAVIIGTVTSNNLTVDTIQITEAPYRGVWAQGSHSRVLRCTFTKIFQVPIMLASFYAAVLEGSTMQDTYDMEASDNYIDRTEEGASLANAGIQIMGNRGDLAPEDTPYRTYRGKALRNTILMPTGLTETAGNACGLSFNYSDYGLAEGNTVTNGTMAISIDASNNTKVIGNTLIGQTLASVELPDSPGSVVEGNVIDGLGRLGTADPSGAGIWMNGNTSLTTDVTIVGNRIFGVNVVGRCINAANTNTTRLTIAGNSLESRYGMTVTGSDLTITGNVITGDGSGTGIGLLNCSSSVVSGNTMKSFVQGVRLVATAGTSDFFNVSNNHFRLCGIPVDGFPTLPGVLGTNIINAQNTVRAS
jgi:hypothetical protein